ncbi:hypothetical protein EDB85DRAFT_2147072 [Lactarius pseudohatsudake]|nr:hypothetical protein EDB85DRAFT_2147072 [Lactarius pseudohatsudake]
MNVTWLQQPPPQSGSTRSVSEAEDITPDFLSIRLVNKCTRVKLSPEPLNLSSIPNKGQLFVVAGTLGWFVAIVRSNTGLDLRSQLSSQDANSDNIFHPQRTIPFLSVSPNYLVFACNDTRLIVGLTQGLVIIFDASAICSTGTNKVTPLHTFLPTTPTPTAVHQMCANPGDVPELVALFREPDGCSDSQLVEVINMSTLQSVAGWSSRGTRPFQSAVHFKTLEQNIVLIIYFIVSWSPKGKQLAIALQSGDIITFSPSETQQAKTFVARPSSMQGQSIVQMTWLSNLAFYTVFSPVGPLDPQADQKHMVIVHDTKCSDASVDITLSITFFPSGVRPPGAFTITLKGWDPTKIFLIIGDSTTADIGVVCCTADDKWQKLSLDKSAPSMPLDADQNETTIISFELDLKNTMPYDITTSTGETVSVPPPPVVWAYASDRMVIACCRLTGIQPLFGPTYIQAVVATTTYPPGQPTFGNPAFGAALSTFTSPPGQAPSGGAFAVFAPASVNWGQPAQTGFDSAATLAPQIPPVATSTISGGSLALSPGIVFAKFTSKLAYEMTAPASVEVPRPSPAFGQMSFASGFGQSGFGQSGFGKVGVGTPMSMTPIATADQSYILFDVREWSRLPLQSAQVGGFGAFTSTGLSAFGQTASNKLDAVPAWKTGDATFISGSGTTVFGGMPSTSPFGNPKPSSQAISAFGGQSSAPKVPVPATPGSVFGQMSVIAATPSSSKMASEDAFSTFSGGASRVGQTGASGLASFSDMLQAGGSTPQQQQLEGFPKITQIVVWIYTGDSQKIKEWVIWSQPLALSAHYCRRPHHLLTSHVGAKKKNQLRPLRMATIATRAKEQINEFLSDTYSEGEPDGEGDDVGGEGGDREKQEERDGDDDEGDEVHRGGNEQGGTEDKDDVPPSDEGDLTTMPLPASRSPSCMPKAERLSINVQPMPTSEPSNASLSEQQPTPTLPSPSLSPSPTPVIDSGRTNTRLLRSSPLANVPVSGGNKEEVRGENPALLKPHPASPRILFDQWDVSATSLSPAEKPTPPQPAAEPLQITKVTPPAITRPKTPLLLIDTKRIVNNHSSASATAPAMVPVALVPTLNLGLSIGAAMKSI